jgi:hypothetical protein
MVHFPGLFTYDNFVCVPCFVLLELFAVHETWDTEVDLVAFLVSTFNANTMGNIDMTYLLAKPRPPRV